MARVKEKRENIDVCAESRKQESNNKKSKVFAGCL